MNKKKIAFNIAPPPIDLQLFSYKPVSIYEGGTETSYSGVINQSCKYTSLNFKHPLTLKSATQEIDSYGLNELFLDGIYVSYRYNSLIDVRLMYKKENQDITIYSLYEDQLQLSSGVKLFDNWSPSFSYNINPIFLFEFYFDIRIIRRTSGGSGGGDSRNSIMYVGSSPYYCIDGIPQSSTSAGYFLANISTGNTLYSFGTVTPPYNLWLEVDLGFKEDIYS